MTWGFIWRKGKEQNLKEGLGGRKQTGTNLVIGGEEEEGEMIMSMSLSKLGVKAKLCDSSAVSK